MKHKQKHQAIYESTMGADRADRGRLLLTSLGRERGCEEVQMTADRGSEDPVPWSWLLVVVLVLRTTCCRQKAGTSCWIRGPSWRRSCFLGSSEEAGEFERLAVSGWLVQAWPRSEDEVVPSWSRCRARQGLTGTVACTASVSICHCGSAGARWRD